MGLFTQRPQEPSAWAALPGEPLRPTSAADRLADASPGIGELGLLGDGIASIAIPVEQVAPTEDPEAGAQPSGDH